MTEYEELLEELDAQGHHGGDLCDCAGSYTVMFHGGVVMDGQPLVHKWDCPVIACLMGECHCEEIAVALTEMDREDYLMSGEWEGSPSD